MKKTLVTCLAIVAVVALASTAGAITCTIDQHPAASLLVPYFQVSVDATGAPVRTGLGARDTLVTIVNASSAPMIAHVSVFSQYSELALDFNIALTGFDVQAMSMADIISGTLPTTTNSSGDEPCQKGDAGVYGDTVVFQDGFLRVVPANSTLTADPLDNSQAGSAYPVPAFGPGLGVVDVLGKDCDGNRLTLAGGFGAIGYVTIDHANYCTVSNPVFDAYYAKDAIGMENNLFGEIIFTSGFGLPTYGMSTLNLEADVTIGQAALDLLDTSPPVRSFYARFWNDHFNNGDTNPGPLAAPTLCPNCSGTNGHPCPSDNSIDCNAPWDVGYGDMREPLGLKWAVRWFDAGATLTSNFQAWRSHPLDTDPVAKDYFCTEGLVEPTSTETFFDEDEHTVSTGICPSPCNNPSFNFELETQQKNINFFGHPTGALAGWAQIDFAGGDVFDQAWVGYSFEGSIALESILVPGTQLDPSTCNPLAFPAPASAPIIPAIPTIPTGTGS
jgi:hypothetical protein